MIDQESQVKDTLVWLLWQLFRISRGEQLPLPLPPGDALDIGKSNTRMYQLTVSPTSGSPPKLRSWPPTLPQHAGPSAARADSFTDLGLHDKKISMGNDSFTNHGFHNKHIKVEGFIWGVATKTVTTAEIIPDIKGIARGEEGGAAAPP
ncbi:hypothetical protein MSG28_001234 [Choristoneura fumiferana]|uniref:Uncharacterized protein n=1 Tax=Choristoneura fumiferana TaxID=7141 RepID=A0ACC0K482_CHOFU|nr:hypothetical protein MSG28_001234 [Choristoneura fumiferana]